MRVAAVQFKGDRRDLEGRRAALARWVWGVGPGVDLIVCPELAVSGYVFGSREEARAVAEDRDGPTAGALAPVARALGSWLVCGFVEQDRDRLFNSAMVIDPAGEVRFVYRKTLLFEADQHWASPGDSGYATFDTDNGNFGVAICMDLNDSRCISWLGKAGPTALAFPTNWIEEGEDVWSYWAWRLQPTSTALVAANTWGDEQHLSFSGRSAIMQRRDPYGDDPRWWVLAASEAAGDGMVRAKLERGASEE